MAQIVVSSETRTVSFEEDVSAHELTALVEFFAEGDEYSVFIQMEPDEAYELGIKLVHYAFNHGVRP